MVVTMASRSGGTLGYISVALLALCLAGCGEAGAPRGAVRGVVTVGGRPLARGRILFISRNAQDGSAVSALIEQGRYALAADMGPIVGANQVEIEEERPLGFSLDDEQAYAATGGAVATPQARLPIPPTLGQTQIQAGDNTFDVHLPAPSP